jgi:hypothetical protein
MTDRVFDAFLRRQLDEGLALARESDLVRLAPIGDPADRFVVSFTCKGLVQQAPGEIVEAEYFEVGILFPSDYLRCANPFQVLTWLGPRTIWHPNISGDAPVICVGRLTPGTSLVDLIYQVFDIITWNKVTMREDDALNRAACEWARGNPARFPVDRRPLKRRALDLHVEEASGGRTSDGAA